MSYRYHDPHIKSLLHFNFPHYLETGDGLADDIGIFSWTPSGNAQLIGSEYPPPDTMNGCPRFGYRCLRTTSNSDYITGSGATQSLPKLELSMWVRDGSSSTSNICLLKNGDSVVLSLTQNSSRQFVLSCSSIGLSLTSAETLQSNTWIYLRVQVSPSSANISVNNSAGTSASLTASSLPDFNKIQLGGFYGELDEFTLRDEFTSGLPTEPTKGIVTVKSLGGFGAGTLGNVTIASNCVMNSYTRVIEGSGNTVLMDTQNVYTGKFGGFKVGDEVLIHEDTYCRYCFRTITGISGTTVTLDASPVSSGAMIQVPHFSSLTINAGVTISPPMTDTTMHILTHGIVAFRVKNDCVINGSIITSGRGYPRVTSMEEAYYFPSLGGFHHSKLPDRFMTNTGGGVFIACGGTLTLTSSARIGAPWSGAGTGGAANGGINSGGGAGYGGGSSGSTGVSGNVGWGGYSAYSPQIGSMPGRNSLIPLSELYTSNTQSSTNHPYPGTSVMIITRRLRADEAAISTGGENAPKNASPEVSGAGAGYCYIACKELL